jgi:hypothetical protein
VPIATPTTNVSTSEARAEPERDRQGLAQDQSSPASLREALTEVATKQRAHPLCILHDHRRIERQSFRKPRGIFGVAVGGREAPPHRPSQPDENEL